MTEFPQLNDILKKHNAEGDEELGQAQFAQLLQPVIQDIADALAVKHVTVVQNLKIVNGSKIRKVDCIPISTTTHQLYTVKEDITFLLKVLAFYS